MPDFLKDGVYVVNIGLERFYDDMKAQGIEAMNLDWKPPAVKISLLAGLKKLKKNNAAERLEAE